jgi:hypothetical protein
LVSFHQDSEHHRDTRDECRCTKSTLSALWDAAFDQGLVSFADDGTVRVSSSLGKLASQALGIDTAPALRVLREAHRANLAAHRARHGF